MPPDFPVALASYSLLLFAGASCAPRWRYILGGFALACGLGFLAALALVPGIMTPPGRRQPERARGRPRWQTR